ncbi:putative transferase, protein kinase RLK-Pelle-LRR-I-1 family [Rosa chinensis]|uniref:Putative transferase, protein kinase RLK-Pelle-LRR-I-1 family n=1 Tax=Rosa chinensis TaxID=74649 RepID=A0A2P6RXJ7_ROSCH|nr:putative transferase, protein kinase RLK-Pelle-LRR-I-1 family [Rosa chinensis]
MSGIFKQFLAPLLAGFALMLLVHAQDQTGFISIDCGLAENSTYSEKITTIDYISDATFIDTGERKLVLPENRNGYQQPYWSLRSFPQGTRNCYKINVKSGTRYLIRASFFYGNYDGENKLPEFELHLGSNLWDLVSLEDASSSTSKELIHFVPAKRSYLHVCVVDTGSGVPFISKIELRPLPYTTYQTETGSLGLYVRLDTGQSPSNYTEYRFPVDIHDRLWHNYAQSDWTQISTLSTTFKSAPDNDYNPPSIVMRTAATPKLESDNLSFYWLPTDPSAEFYLYMHFSEVVELQANQSRQLDITWNGEHYYGPFVPNFFDTTTVLSTKALTGGKYNFSISNPDGNSVLQPILNGIEIYQLKEFLQIETKQEDGKSFITCQAPTSSYQLIDAITNIKSTYTIEKNWQGDPCSPKNYLWEGLKCSYPTNESPRIISLDLSNNNLTGPLPDFLSQLPNLTIINLENNKLTGSVPVGLIERRRNGLLSLRCTLYKILCGNPNLSGNSSCKKKKNNFIIPIVGSVVGIFCLLSVAVICWCLKRKREDAAIYEKPHFPSLELEQKNRQFTYCEILKFTNNLERTLGKGGFGTVYHGYIDKLQVAVNLLLRVHHTNLTSLVGYCNDENNMGLVYEYMANGNLQEHLSGLEYLHYGCKPPIIHRDVKSANILLTENFQAKVSDFGLSRNFPTDGGTHISTVVAGTPGYLDPEYYLTSRLNEKSDTYSFGIVLLEIITSRPVITGTLERIHISQWVGFMLAQGDINSIVDPRLERNFNVNSVWKVVEIAMACVSPNATKRPMMSQVLMELKECMATEELSQKKQMEYETELGEPVEMVSLNDSIRMLRPSVR